MAIIRLNSHHQRQFGGAPPYGNFTTLPFVLKTNASGIVGNSNAEDPIAAEDVIVLGELPAGMNLADAQLFVLTGMTAAAAGAIGFRYKDGEDDEDVPQDDEYFFAAGTDLATAARLRATQAKLVTLPKNAELILTAAGANDQESDIRVHVSGELTGPL